MSVLTHWDRAIERIALTAWVGAIWAVGFLVVPALFAGVEDRRLAGDIAGQVFHMISYTGIACAVVILMMVLIRGLRSGVDWKFPMLIVIMLTITLVAEFVVVPQMEDIRMQAGGELVAGTVLHERFSQMHHVAGGLFIAVSVLGLIALLLAEPNLFVRGRDRKEPLP